LTLDLSSQGGRLRDLSVSSWNYQLTRYALATCCTSNGKTLVLSLNTLQNLYSADPESPPDFLYEKSSIISNSLTVEPRFTCTVSWIRANQTKKAEASNEKGTDVDNDHGAEETKAEKKRRRKNKAGDKDEEEDGAGRETKVRFQEVVVTKPVPSEPSPQPKKKKSKKKTGKGKKETQSVA
jgi:hypothetical protein